ncbi:hypothetical protein E2562_039036, partial [Oryza meyeriana var. granulata]
MGGDSTRWTAASRAAEWAEWSQWRTRKKVTWLVRGDSSPVPLWLARVLTGVEVDPRVPSGLGRRLDGVPMNSVYGGVHGLGVLKQWVMEWDSWAVLWCQGGARVGIYVRDLVGCALYTRGSTYPQPSGVQVTFLVFWQPRGGTTWRGCSMQLGTQ